MCCGHRRWSQRSPHSAVLCGLLYAGLAWWRWRTRPAELATGALASSYVNAGNLGVPIAVYVLGDASYVAPVLLFQVLVLAPVGLTVLAGSRAESHPVADPAATHPGSDRLRIRTVGRGGGLDAAAAGAATMSATATCTTT